MSNSRHRPSLVRSNATTHPPGRVQLPTQPGWDYLVFARSGVFTAITDTQAWTVPTHRALCVPDGTRVRIRTARRVAIRCLYIDAGLDALGAGLRVINLTPLTRELVTHAVVNAPMDLDAAPDQALVTLLADQVAQEPQAPLHLALPSDPVAREVADAIMTDPANGLEHHLRTANASRRTIERRFVAQTHTSLGQWRRRARILAAVSMLAQGATVTETAVAVGYASPSSFVSAFKAELGSSPRAFLRS